MERSKSSISELELHDIDQATLREIFFGMRENKTIAKLRIDANLPEENATDLGEMLRFNDYLKGLLLKECTISPQAFATITHGLHGNRSLKNLEFEENSLTPESNDALRTMLQQNRGLTSLSLVSNSGLTFFLSDASRDMGRALQLERLELQMMGIENDHVEALTQRLASEDFGNLSGLAFECNPIHGLGIRHITDLVSTSHIKDLTLSYTLLGDNGASIVADMLRQPDSSLLRLFLNRAHFGDTGLSALVTALRQNASSNLQVLQLKQNDFGDAGLDALSKALPSLNNVIEIELSVSSNVPHQTQERLCRAFDQNQSIVEIGVEGMDEDLKEKIAYFECRNMLSHFMHNPRFGDLPGRPAIRPHVLAAYGSMDGSHVTTLQQFILRTKLPWLLENQIESLGRKRRAEGDPAGREEGDLLEAEEPLLEPEGHPFEVEGEPAAESN